MRILNLFWNTGGPVALAHVLTPLFSTIYTDHRDFEYRTVYIFGVRIFRHLVV